MSDGVDKWFATLVANELKRLHEWNEEQQKCIDALKPKVTILWFIVYTMGGAIAVAILGWLFSG